MGCDQGRQRHPIDLRHVSIRAPAWGAIYPPPRTACDTGCFNPRTRMGCDINYLSGIGVTRVSIRAPAWGAIVFLSLSSPCPLVSIRAPAWGAMYYYGRKNELYKCFNPRTRMGCDELRAAPRARRRCFNPRTRMGCDGRKIVLFPTLFPFQSAHPHGVRSGQGACRSSPAKSFNPRTRMGCDPVVVLVRYGHAPVSIRAPAWGAMGTWL